MVSPELELKRLSPSPLFLFWTMTAIKLKMAPDLEKLQS